VPTTVVYTAVRPFTMRPAGCQAEPGTAGGIGAAVVGGVVGGRVEVATVDGADVAVVAPTAVVGPRAAVEVEAAPVVDPAARWDAPSEQPVSVDDPSMVSDRPASTQRLTGGKLARPACGEPVNFAPWNEPAATYHGAVFRHHTQDEALLAAKADVESLYGRLGHDVSSLTDGGDPANRQGLADAAERYNTAGAQLGRVQSLAELGVVRSVILEGLSSTRQVRTRLGLDPGPEPSAAPVQPVPEHQGLAGAGGLGGLLGGRGGGGRGLGGALGAGALGGLLGVAGGEILGGLFDGGREGGDYDGDRGDDGGDWGGDDGGGGGDF
jgi:hypothetical protein